MQRKLAYALSPVPRLPLCFMLGAPWFALLAALVLLGAGEGAFASRWTLPALAATHLLTLGYLAMAMAGSMLQLIPVVAGTPIVLGRAWAAWTWAGLALGTLLLATALGLNLVSLFLPAAALLASAFVPLVACLARALFQATPQPAMPMVRGMRVAVAGLVLAVALGVALASGLGGVAAVPVLLLVDLHAVWGLVGWVAMLVLGVAFQVIPMFQSSRLYPAPVTRWAIPLLGALLLAWSAARIAAPERAPLAAGLVALFVTAFAALSAWLLARRQRKQVDATTLYWRLALCCLAASAALAMLPGADTLALATGIVFIVGFAMGVVNGMLYKIVPFLLWYHLQHDPRARKGEVPSLRDIIDERQARRQFWWHAAALAALLGAAFWPAWLARPAGLLLAIASLRLALDLGRAALRCLAIQKRLQPS